MTDLIAFEIKDHACKITTRGTKATFEDVSAWAALRPSKSGAAGVIVQDGFKSEADTKAWIAKHPCGLVSATDLTSSQRKAIFPGPGNPDYAKGPEATMAVLRRLGVVNQSGFLSEMGRKIRKELAR